DNTYIEIHAPTQGKTVANHNASTPVGLITFDIPSVSLVTGTVNITLPGGKTLKRARLSYYHKMTEGPLPYVEFSDVPIVGGVCSIRITGEGQFNVIDVKDTEGNDYGKLNILTWSGGSSPFPLSVTLP
ncbi:MAG: hypothetical protein LBL44_01670, partial [Treponema sp.]|nr:hypothetical protein [Treponema sp.]